MAADNFQQEVCMADIQLSSQLFEDVQQAVLRQQPDADQGVILQYLAAVMGYMLGSQRAMTSSDRDALMDDLCAFARHVVDDLTQREQEASQPPAQAFGYWTPPGA
ncbi:MAG TPA: hypothetical protein PLX99_03635 [Gammaproteobacteria bacterium]|nr:hypothetical protein [Chromatiaceae bacterium]HOP15671.1 hypothetical protein [Gammaproteobacteria bacterium]